jgi:hypothetical protein
MSEQPKTPTQGESEGSAVAHQQSSLPPQGGKAN